jgi:twitching motility protein PilT
MSDLDLEDDLAFGVIAIELGLLSRDQLTDALARQVRDPRSLGRILVHQGWISEAQAHEVLSLQGLRRTGSREAPLPAPSVVAPKPNTAAAEPPPLFAASISTRESALRTVRELVEAALRHSASTIHLHAGLPPSLRIHRELRSLTGRVFEATECDALARALLDDEQIRELEARGQVDHAAEVEGLARLRVNVYRQQRGVDIVLRLIQREVPTLEALRLPEVVAEIAALPRGMALFTGPGGCGKSTTMAAVVDRVNTTRAGTILTIEDPVEFVHPSKKSVVRQRQVGRDASSFARALRAALRQDPNVIVIGELRDRETIAMALTAAETGHLVLATLTTSNVVATISRLVGVFPPDQQRHVRTMLGESLRAVVSQRLARRADGKGRIPAFEILVSTPAVANLIRENKLQQVPSILQSGGAKGMSTLDASLERLVAVGAIDRAEAALHAENASAPAET